MNQTLKLISSIKFVHIGWVFDETRLRCVCWWSCYWHSKLCNKKNNGPFVDLSVEQVSGVYPHITSFQDMYHPNNMRLIHSDWIGLGLIHSDWIGLGLIHSDWIGLGLIHYDGIGLGLIHYVWIGLGLILYDWIALGLIHYDYRFGLGLIH